MYTYDIEFTRWKVYMLYFMIDTGLMLLALSNLSCINYLSFLTRYRYPPFFITSPLLLTDFPYTHGFLEK